MKLTDKEKQCLVMIHLGGMSVFNDNERPDAKTVASLIRKGLFGRDTLNDAGKALAKELAEADHV